MSLFFAAAKSSRGMKEQRSTWVWPNFQIMGGSYADINPSATAETSLHSVAYHAAVDLVCSLGSELPMHVYSGEGKERVKRTMPSYLEDPAGDGHGRPDWCYQALLSWLVRGNLYGDILEKSPRNFPTQILFHHPDSVSGHIASGGRVEWVVDGIPVTNPGNFLHRRVYPVPGRVQGLSPVQFHASTLGLSLTSMQFGLQWFREGAHPSGMLTNEEALINADQAKTIKQRFMESLRGSREPLVMGKGWKFEKIQLSPDESQFLETQGFSAAECARIVGPGIAEILGYESGGSMTYSNIESRAAHVLVFAANKWFRRLERLLSGMLPNPQYVLIDRDALLQSTTLERYKAHALALANKWKVVNEVREDEDMPPVDWGDEPVGATQDAAPTPVEEEPKEGPSK